MKERKRERATVGHKPLAGSLCQHPRNEAFWARASRTPTFLKQPQGRRARQQRPYDSNPRRLRPLAPSIRLYITLRTSSTSTPPRPATDATLSAARGHSQRRPALSPSRHHALGIAPLAVPLSLSPLGSTPNAVLMAAAQRPQSILPLPPGPCDAELGGRGARDTVIVVPLVPLVPFTLSPEQ